MSKPTTLREIKGDTVMIVPFFMVTIVVITSGILWSNYVLRNQITLSHQIQMKRIIDLDKKLQKCSATPKASTGLTPKQKKELDSAIAGVNSDNRKINILALRYAKATKILQDKDFTPKAKVLKRGLHSEPHRTFLD